MRIYSRFFQVGVDGEDLAGGVHVEAARCREGDGIGGAVENGGSQVGLRGLDHLAQGGLGDVELFGRVGDAPFL